MGDARLNSVHRYIDKGPWEMISQLFKEGVSLYGGFSYIRANFGYVISHCLLCKLEDCSDVWVCSGSAQTLPIMLGY